MVVELLIWKGWTVDLRLRQFRKVEFNDGKPQLVIADFDGEVAQDMYYDYCQDKYDYHMEEGREYQKIQMDIEEGNFGSSEADAMIDEMLKEV